MKHIVCFGDSNTHGYCADPADCADGGDRFNEQERWTCLLQDKLGPDYRVLEEGLSGRTTVFDDPIHEGLRGLDDIFSCLMSHEPVDLLIIMLGTNDTKSRFGVNAAAIGIGMGRSGRQSQIYTSLAQKPKHPADRPAPHWSGHGAMPGLRSHGARLSGKIRCSGTLFRRCGQNPGLCFSG